MRGFLALLVCSFVAASALSACTKQAPPVVGKWGYINKKGNFIILPKFDEASEFTKDGAIVKLDKRLMRLQANPPGESSLPVTSSDTAGLPPLPTVECAEAGEKKFKIMDGTEVVFDPNAKADLPVVLAEGGFICAKFDSQYTYIDKTGSLALDRWFTEARPFAEGRAAVKENGKWGYINKKGAFVVKPQYLEAGTFAEGLAPVKVIVETPPQ